MHNFVSSCFLICKMLGHWIMHIFQMLIYFFTYQKLHLLISSLILYEKSFNSRKLSCSQLQIYFFQNSHFSLKALVLSSQQLIISSFLIESCLFCIYLRKSPAKYSSKNSNDFLLFFFRIKWYSMKKFS